jgi:hypothetical protein
VEETTVTIDEEGWQLILMIALGVFFAFAEALDLDVLLGILFMPVIKVLKYFSIELEMITLDPSYWSAKMGDAYNNMCKHNPAGFVITDFSFFAVFVVLILFEADLSKWWRERHLRNAGYDDLEEDAEEDPLKDERLEDLFRELDKDGSGEIDRKEMNGAIKRIFGEDISEEVVDEMMAAADRDGDGTVGMKEFKLIMKAGPVRLGGKAKEMTDPDKMQVMLRNAREELEEVNLYVLLRGPNVDAAVKKGLLSQRSTLEARIDTLSGFLSALETEAAEEVDLEAAAREAEEAEAKKKREGNCGETTKLAVTVLKNTISGVLTIYLYFMDLISDYQVTNPNPNPNVLTIYLYFMDLISDYQVTPWSRPVPCLYPAVPCPALPWHALPCPTGLISDDLRPRR